MSKFKVGDKIKLNHSDDKDVISRTIIAIEGNNYVYRIVWSDGVVSTTKCFVHTNDFYLVTPLEQLL